MIFLLYSNLYAFYTWNSVVSFKIIIIISICIYTFHVCTIQGQTCPLVIESFMSCWELFWSHIRECICICRYDHLSRVLTKVLDERPNNVVDIFEEVSKDSKRSKFTSDVDTVRDKLDQSTEVALAKVQEKLFAVRCSNSFCIEYLYIYHRIPI